MSNYPTISSGPQEVTVIADDGYPIACTHYGNAKNPHRTVVVAGCIGAKQSYYRHFADYLASNDMRVVTFDYRGMGESRKGSLRGFHASLKDWAERDLEAVVNDSLLRSKTAVVGHSFGGHAFGLLSRVNELDGLYTFASGAGHHCYMSKVEALKVRLMWSVVGPVTTFPSGYLPSKLIGLGQDLPLGVYRQWKQWCASPTYFFERPDNDYQARFDRVNVPIHAVASIDDPWSPPKSVRAFLAGYRNAGSIQIDETGPAKLGVAKIGHMGYFRRNLGEPLWQEARQWLDALVASKRVVA